MTVHLKEERCTGGKTKIICSGGKFKHILNSSEKVFYGGDTKFSCAACQWIEAQAMETGKHIHHKMCGHGGERMVKVWVLNDKGEKEPASFLVDGYEPETNTVYQSHRCHWHGHTCLKNHTKRQQKLFKENYYTTMGDWLRVYNLVDIVWFIEAFRKMAGQYYSDKIDVCKDAVSIPDISMTCVLNKSLEKNKKLQLYSPAGICHLCLDTREEL